jgi:trimethylamine:corrinoid methyltransferase-like protein
MNNWIKAHKKYCADVDYKGEQVAFEAIPVSALEELFSKDGEQLAREMYPWNDIPEMDEKNPEWWKEHGKQIEVFQNNIINKLQSKAFLEAYNIQEVKMQALKKEVEELKAVIQGYAPNITDPNDCKQCGGEGGWYEDVAGDGLGSMWISCDECGEDDEPLNPQP